MSSQLAAGPQRQILTKNASNKKTLGHFPLNPGCLITGSCHNNGFSQTKALFATGTLGGGTSELYMCLTNFVLYFGTYFPYWQSSMVECR